MSPSWMSLNFAPIPLLLDRSKPAELVVFVAEAHSELAITWSLLWARLRYVPDSC